MSAGAHDSVTVWRFIRRHFVRIVIGANLVAVVSIAVFVWMPYLREQRIARKVEALGGTVTLEYCGPNWIPTQIRERCSHFLYRIDWVHLIGIEGSSSDVLSELPSLTHLKRLTLYHSQITETDVKTIKRLTRLERLDLGGTQITDVELQGFVRLRSLYLTESKISDTGLRQLKAMTNLEVLWLNVTTVTDSGLEHLKGLSNLRELNVEHTQTTAEGRAEGRAMLRMALPNCKIEPEP